MSLESYLRQEANAGPDARYHAKDGTVAMLLTYVQNTSSHDIEKHSLTLKDIDRVARLGSGGVIVTIYPCGCCEVKTFANSVQAVQKAFADLIASPYPTKTHHCETSDKARQEAFAEMGF